MATILGLPTVFVGWKGHEYAAEPSGEKACAPLSPEHAVGQPSSTAGNLPLDTLPWSQQGGTINDASCLNTTSIYGIVQVKDVADIHHALRFAHDHHVPVSIAGVRHSMGGQAFYKGAIVLDMTAFKHMSLDASSKVLTVQSGATWHDIQNFLHPRFAVKAMQSTDIFTVGGSIAVNAHGMDHHVGAIGKTIRAMRVMLADGSIHTTSRTHNPELFQFVIGGYGLFGIILDVDLEVTDNVIYAPGRRLMDYTEFPHMFATVLRHDPKLGLLYGHLSTAPQSLLQEMLLYTYAETAVTNVVMPLLREVSHIKLRRLVLNVSKLGAVPLRLKWFAEKHIEPRLEACSMTRNQAMQQGEACLVSRNEPMHDSVPYLKNNLRHETDILQEYFIPRAQFVPFIDGLRRIIVDNNTNLLNASVRVVHQEDSFLNYAPSEMFAIVLYINQKTTAAGHAGMRRVTAQLIDFTTSLHGTFFLPYQLHYTPGQLQRAYPDIEAFFAAKRRYDPQQLLTNTFYETFAKRDVTHH